jgi:streptogramin lyase
MEFLYKHLSEQPRSILTLAADLPLPVDELFRQALAKQPEQRPQRATEFMRRLREALAGGGRRDESTAPAARPMREVGATSIRGREAVPAGASVHRGREAVAPARPAVAARPGRRSVPGILIAVGGAGAVVLVLALGLGALVFRDRLSGPRIHTYPVGQSPRSLLSDGRSIWVANFDDDSLARLTATGCEASPDPCGQAQASFPTPSLPVAMVHDGQWLWVAGALEGKLVGLDPASGEIRAEYDLSNVPSALAHAAGALWTANELDASLTRLDPQTGDRTDIPLEFRPLSLLWDGDLLWVASQADRLLARVDAGSGEVLGTYSLEGAPTALAFDGDSLWVALSDLDLVVELDRSTGAARARVQVGEGPRALLFDGTTLWSADQRADRVTGLDPTTGTVVHSLRVPGGPYALASMPCGPGCVDLWIAAEAVDRVSRVRLP